MSNDRIPPIAAGLPLSDYHLLAVVEITTHVEREVDRLSDRQATGLLDDSESLHRLIEWAQNLRTSVAFLPCQSLSGIIAKASLAGRGFGSVANIEEAIHGARGTREAVLISVLRDLLNLYADSAEGRVEGAVI